MSRSSAAPVVIFVCGLLVSSPAVSQSFQVSHYGLGSWWSDGVSVGDLNGDGFPDSVSSNLNSQSISILLGDGSAGFGPPMIYSTGHYHSGRVNAAADMNLDGELDLLNGELQGTIMVLRGNGAGSLTYFAEIGPFVPFGSPTEIACLKIDDLNGDGFTDIVALDNISRNFSAGAYARVVFCNGAAGVLGVNSVAVPAGAYWLDLGDLSGDGIPDIVTANGGSSLYSTSDISIRLGVGAGSFNSGFDVPLGLLPVCPLIADINKDGVNDLLVSDLQLGVIYSLIGSGGGSFSLASTALAAGGTQGVGTAELRVTDFDADGNTDLLALNYYASTATVLRGDGAGTFSSIGYFGTGSGPLRACVTDLDIDGRMDAVAVNTGDLLTVFHNMGVLQPTPGTFGYGTGTGGCLGRLGVTLSDTPAIGSQSFGFSITNTPPNSMGLLIITDAPDFVGSDPFGLGAILYVNLFAATQVYALDIPSDVGLTGFCPAPLPNHLSLVGQQFAAQSLWLESVPDGGSCSASPFHLVSSKAMRITITP